MLSGHGPKRLFFLRCINAHQSDPRGSVQTKNDNFVAIIYSDHFAE
jgi:hypothetical protein